MKTKLIGATLIAMIAMTAVPAAAAYGCATLLGVSTVCADSYSTASNSVWAGTAYYTSKGWGWSVVGTSATVSMTSSKTAGDSCVTPLAGGSCETFTRWGYGPYGCNTVTTNTRSTAGSVWDYETRCYGSGLDVDPVGLALIAIADAENSLNEG